MDKRDVTVVAFAVEGVLVGASAMNAFWSPSVITVGVALIMAAMLLYVVISQALRAQSSTKE